MNAPATVAELEDRLSEPTPGVIATFRSLPGDLIFLGVAGKMGPTLARMAKRASDAAGIRRRVIGVSRFSDASQIGQLNAQGIETIRCNLMDEEAVAQLPEVENVVYCAAMKFGATGNEALTWAMNTWLPSVVCRKFRRSRIVAFSTGNVYGLVPVSGGGSVEADAPQPVGEYAMSCLGRERMFEHFSRTLGVPVSLLRLNYACELRYGVLVDLAKQIWAGQPVDLGMGWFNCIWQGDANAQTFQALALTTSPPFVLNLTGPELLRVRDVAEELGRRMNRPATFTGAEADSALLNNAAEARRRFGPPRISASELLGWVAGWVMRGGPDLGKPTHFESRDGRF
ncbi:MAG: nucleoside-diphosphate-sugar epimerase [Limisphaerales bacterium]|nr:MAG: nucleoside-diphosphate-sugar epimerase [Limisphaerales bacterium]KAG0509273.1 MAG: nucleoside-diphosphate-sugar epimerase [Limisphaerales bacterium]TXT52188.1 MAG: nucleoside-diphosphate-sugar epimerase [Limisphaerales bacterium]